MNQNRVQKHKLLNKKVMITRGEFKGQVGRVTHVNGIIAHLEMSLRARVKEVVNINDIEEVRDDHLTFDKKPANNYYNTAGGMGDQSDYGNNGGQTTYNGGMTAYNPGSQYEYNNDGPTYQ